MYLNFYNLNKKPFSLAPDPEFLYLSQQHKDALGAIIYGIREREGFVSVIGEVGTGKTTIVRSYLHKTDRDRITPVFIFNSNITFPALLKTFLYEIGINANEIQRIKSSNSLVRFAYKTMLERTRQGENLVLIIDEAQHLPLETLASLCILSNFETTRIKLIQIVLVGQPELQNKLDLYELRQLRQRVAYRARITPLSTKDSITYIHHRLSLSTDDNKPVFNKNAIKEIVKYSRGVPRVINILCENSLVAGYGLQKKPVSLKIVKQVIAEYEGEPACGLFKKRKLASSVLALLLTVLFTAVYYLSSHSSGISIGELLQLSYTESSQSETAFNGEGVVPIITGRGVAEETLPLEEATTISSSSEETHSVNEHAKQLQTQLSKQEGPSISEALPPLPLKNAHNIKVIRTGDTLTKLCLATYGFVDRQLLLWVMNHNANIFDIDEIQAGGIIYFPELEAPNLKYEHKNLYNHSSTTIEGVVSR